jgi:hypothetical protein
MASLGKNTSRDFCSEGKMLIEIIGCDRPAIPKQVVDEWFIEDEWEVEDPLWRAALHVRFPSQVKH